MGVQLEHELVRGVAQGDQLQMRLQSEARLAIERRDLLKRQRRQFGGIERFDKCPLDARDVHCEAMAAARPARGERPAIPAASIRGCAD